MIGKFIESDIKQVVARDCVEGRMGTDCFNIFGADENVLKLNRGDNDYTTS